MENQMPQPGAQHELLRPFEGTFRAVVKIHMGPGEPIVSAGTMVNRFVLGGLYLAQEYQGDDAEGPFPAFEGRGFWGFNFGSNLYEGFWIDNASSIMQREDGQVDESGKLWEMHSEIVHPQAGKMKKRSLIRLLDDDHHEMESFMTPEGGTEMKTMEISYTRD